MTRSSYQTMQSLFSSTLTWQLVATVLVWWTANTITSITSKRVMKGGDVTHKGTTELTSAFLDFRWVELTALQHFLGTVLSVLWLKIVMRKTVWPVDVQKKTIYIAALGNLVGNLGTNGAYSLVSSGATQVIKACEPITTFILSIVLYKQHEPHLLTTLISIVIMIFGACTFVVLDTTFNVWGLVAAICSNIGFPVRNIYLKKLSDAWENPLQKYAVISLCSIVLLVPVIFLKFIFAGIFFFHAPSDNSISALSHFTYNVASVGVLQNVSPLTHAILNLSKRVFVIIINLIYFHTPLSQTMVIGLVVFCVGLFMYSLRGNLSQRIIQWVSFFVLVAFCLFFASPFNFGFSNESTALTTKVEVVELPSPVENINMAWTYDRPIPHDVITNIVTLHQRYPDTHIHIECGTFRCVREITGLENKMITADLVVVTEIIKGTALEKWFARHPFNKVLALSKFEDHLQQAVSLGIMWNRGGVYIDPKIKIDTEFTLPTNKNAWIGLPVSKTSSQTTLEFSSFPKEHPFIRLLAEQFLKNYPKEGNQTRTFSFDFNYILNDMLDEFCKTDQEHCPSIMEVHTEKLSLPGATNHFGALSFNYRVRGINIANLGDEVQDFPGLQFLPFIDHFLDRDALNSYSGSDKVTAFFNAWWGAARDWPPHANIDPILLSIHIDPPMAGKWTSHADYLRKREPIGCRDTGTLDLMKKHNVKAYFSACLTLMLKNPNIEKRTDKIYLADVKENVKDMLPQEIKDKAITVHHNMPGNLKKYSLLRFTEAYKLMEMYATAKVVVTQRIHCALPCVAMGTPVIFINSQGMPGGGGSKGHSSSRTVGLTPLFHTVDFYNMDIEEAQKWLSDFPWNNPPPNPSTSLMMRMRATFWNTIRNYESLYDAGHKFGLVPLLPPRSIETTDLVFHVMLEVATSQQNSKSLKWQYWGCVESIFHHHPLARVIVHSNTVDDTEFNVLSEAGYNIEVQTYTVKELMKDTPIQNLDIGERHDSFLIPVLMLYKWGGVYLDTSVILVKPITSFQANNIARQSTGTACSWKLMYYEQHSTNLRTYLESTMAKSSQPGTDNTQFCSNVQRNHHNHANVTVYSFASEVHCYDPAEKNVLDSILSDNVYAVELNLSKEEVSTNDVKDGSICKHILQSYCVICNKLYLL